MKLRRAILFVNGTLAAAMLAMFILVVRMESRNAPAAEALPKLGTLSDFELTDSAGHGFGTEQLDGKVWVADFVFTTCAGSCPVLTTNMAELQRDLADTTEVHYVSVSVDPETDTPEVLAKYADVYSADTSRWHFLTGAEDRIQDLTVNGFKVGSIDEPLFHSNRFVLVDTSRSIRGYYTGTEAGDMLRLREDIKSLLEERAS